MKLKIRDINKIYKSKDHNIEVLSNINITINSGEFVVILGPSGSGKSTLLEIIGGLNAPSKGQIIINNIPVKGPSIERAFVFQDYALFPWRTVMGNLKYVFEVQGKCEKWKDTCEKCLSLVELEGFKNAFPYQLSGGMKQRVALARALVGNPDILLMDEPFAALDAITRHNLQLMLIEIICGSKTVVFVTHSIEEALILANRIVVLSSRPGQIKKIINVPGRPGKRDMKSHSILKLHDEIWNMLE